MISDFAKTVLDEIQGYIDLYACAVDGHWRNVPPCHHSWRNRGKGLCDAGAPDQKKRRLQQHLAMQQQQGRCDDSEEIMGTIERNVTSQNPWVSYAPPPSLLPNVSLTARPYSSSTASAAAQPASPIVQRHSSASPFSAVTVVTSSPRSPLGHLHSTRHLSLQGFWCRNSILRVVKADPLATQLWL